MRPREPFLRLRPGRLPLGERLLQHLRGSGRLGPHTALHRAPRGLRLSFQAFADNVEAFASDCAKAIAAHLVSGEAFVERGRRLALAELRGERELRKALEELRADALQVDF